MPTTKCIVFPRSRIPGHSTQSWKKKGRRKTGAAPEEHPDVKRASASGSCYLGLGEHEGSGHLKALGPGQILVLLELLFQLEELLAGEGRAGPPGLPQDGGMLVT